MRYILFPPFIAFQMQVQEVLFEGHVFDNKTKEPITYVNLSFLNTLKGSYTDEQAHFYLEVPTPFLEKQVHISSSGYNNTIIAANLLYG